MSSDGPSQTGDALELESGHLIQGRYRIESTLGAGGFAQVFEARDEHLNRAVAIKFLRLDIEGNSEETRREKLMTRFRREARVTAKLDHPNVIDIFDFGILDVGGGVPFIVMKLLPGKPLRKYLNEDGALEPDRTLDLFTPCLEGLGRAHAEGIVHKDLTPKNLFLTDVGTRAEALQIFDFGIAHIKSHHGTTRFTADDKVIGTMRYLPPEYIDSQRITKAFDVYQMGLIVVEMLTGEPLVSDPSQKRCVMIHLSGVRKHIPDVLLEGPLGGVLSKALASEPEGRFEDAHAFADALDDLRPDELPALGTIRGSSDRHDLPLEATRPSDEVPLEDETENDDTSPPQSPHSERGSDPDSSDTRHPSPSTNSTASAELDSDESRKTVRLESPDPSEHTLEAGEASADMEEASGMNRRTWGLLSLGLLALLAAGGGIMMTGASEERHGPSASVSAGAAVEGPEQTNSEASTPMASEDAVRADAGTGDYPPSDVGAKASERVAIELQTEPQEAEIVQGERRIGTTPTTVKLEPGDAGTRTFVLEREGHRTRRVQLGPEDAPSVEVELATSGARDDRAPEEGARAPSDETGSSSRERQSDNAPGEAEDTAPHNRGRERPSTSPGTRDDASLDDSSDSESEAEDLRADRPESDDSNAADSAQGREASPTSASSDNRTASERDHSASEATETSNDTNEDDSGESKEGDEDRMMIAP